MRQAQDLHLFLGCDSFSLVDPGHRSPAGRDAPTVFACVATAPAWGLARQDSPAAPLKVRRRSASQSAYWSWRRLQVLDVMAVAATCQRDAIQFGLDIHAPCA